MKEHYGQQHNAFMVIMGVRCLQVSDAHEKCCLNVLQSILFYPALFFPIFVSLHRRCSFQVAFADAYQIFFYLIYHSCSPQYISRCLLSET